ncbi:hypothetical protein ABIF21_005618 [Bradyrhizobium elkanii]
MHLSADMVRDQAHDPLAVGGGHRSSAILQPAGQPVDPEPAVGVEHHLDDRGVFEEGRDRGAKRGAQHARAPRKRFRMEWNAHHDRPPSNANRNNRSATGMDRKGRK